MKKTVALLTAVSVGSLAAPAMAQDTNAAFTGPRIEAVLGYDITKAGSDADNDANENDDQDIDGVLYGAAIGYDFAAGGFLIGAEAELTDSSAKVEFGDRSNDSENFGFGRVGAGRDLYFGARAGILAAPTTLVYVKGGYTNARYDFLASDGETELDQSVDTDGFRIGAGVEQAIGGTGFVKIEYRYSNYSRAEVDFEDDTRLDTDRVDIDLDRHQVVAGVGIRF